MFGICTNFISSEKYSLHEDMWDALCEIFDFIEFPAYPIMEKDDREFAAFSRRIREQGVKCYSLTNIFPPELHILEAPERDVRDYALRLTDRAMELDASLLVFGSGKARIRPPYMSRDEALCRMADIIMKHLHPSGLDIMIEPLRQAEGETISTVKDAVELISLTAEDRIGVVADSYNLVQDDTAYEMEEYGRFIGHVHISGPERELPACPYSGQFRKFMDALRKIRYGGSLSFECLAADLATLQSARHGIEAYLRGEE